MKAYHFFAGFLCATLLGAASKLLTPEPGYILPARITSVHDGDTLTVEFKPHTANLRLLDCWSAEVTGVEKPEGIKAKANLEKLIAPSKGEVMVTIPWRQNIGAMTSISRVLAKVVTADGVDLSKAQVQGGFATVEKKEK